MPGAVRLVEFDEAPPLQRRQEAMHGRGRQAGPDGEVAEAVALLVLPQRVENGHRAIDRLHQVARNAVLLDRPTDGPCRAALRTPSHETSQAERIALVLKEEVRSMRCGAPCFSPWGSRRSATAATGAAPVKPRRRAAASRRRRASCALPAPARPG